jgi:hypothetical protein
MTGEDCLLSRCSILYPSPGIGEIVSTMMEMTLATQRDKIIGLKPCFSPKRLAIRILPN